MHKNTIRTLLLLSLLALPLPAACGGEETTRSSTSGPCLENATMQCECDESTPGAATCIDGVFGDCQCTSANTCGNGQIDGEELCDGSDLNGHTCATATMNARPSGTLACSSQCTFDISGCTDGTVNDPGAGGTMGTGGLTGDGGVTGN
jgi:hypothetical protein